jgi:hypothetical protein
LCIFTLLRRIRGVDQLISDICPRPIASGEGRMPHVDAYGGNQLLDVGEATLGKLRSRSL